MKAVHRALTVLYGLCAVLAAVCLAGIATIILAGAIGRQFGVVVPSANSIAGYLVAASTFLALAPTLRSGGHIRVELFASRLAPGARRWLEVWCLGLAATLVAFLSYSSILEVFNSYRFHVTSPGLLPIPMWIPQLPMAFGLTVMTVALVELLLGVLVGHMPDYADPTMAVADEEAGL